MDVIYIDLESFRLNLIKQVLEEAGHQVLILDSTTESRHFITDLFPDFLILHAESLGCDPEFCSWLNSSGVAQIPVIGIGSPKDYEGIISKERILDFLEIPLRPFEIESKLLKFQSLETLE